MKYLVISDTHLTDRFDKRKFDLLVSLINDADRVIINGDFWEGFETTFEEFVSSPWKDLFPLLKAKKAVYIYGNHDEKDWSDNRVQLFSETQTDFYELESGGIIFRFEHGHRQVPIEGWDIPFMTDKQRQRFSSVLHEVVVRVFTANVMRWLFKRLNKTVKKTIRATLDENHFFVCGHTHVAENDPQGKFLNSGFIQFGTAQYILIEDGVVQSKTRRY